MFLGSLPRKPDKATAYKELRQNLLIMGVWVAVIRAAPYVLHYLTADSDSDILLEISPLQ